MSFSTLKGHSMSQSVKKYTNSVVEQSIQNVNCVRAFKVDRNVMEAHVGILAFDSSE